MRRLNGVVLILVVLAGVTAAAAQPSDPPTPNNTTGGERPLQKNPWEWTIDERLAVRLDPTKIAQRQADELGDGSARAQSVPARPHTPQNHTIDGWRNPELLLPHEVFASLLGGLARDEEGRRRKRESFRRGVVESGFDEELFWADLRSAASEYVDTYIYPAPGNVPPRTSGAKCRAAFTALNNARQVFGPERFDRLLYEIVAPGLATAFYTNAPDPAAALRREAGGCQR